MKSITWKASDEMARLDAEVKRLQSIIDHITDVGVYPQSVRDGSLAYEKRNDWQNGWNAAATEMIRRHEEATSPGWKPEPEDE